MQINTIQNENRVIYEMSNRIVDISSMSITLSTYIFESLKSKRQFWRPSSSQFVEYQSEMVDHTIYYLIILWNPFHYGSETSDIRMKGRTNYLN